MDRFCLFWYVPMCSGRVTYMLVLRGVSLGSAHHRYHQRSLARSSPNVVLLRRLEDNTHVVPSAGPALRTEGQMVVVLRAVTTPSAEI